MILFRILKNADFFNLELQFKQKSVKIRKKKSRRQIIGSWWETATRDKFPPTVEEGSFPGSIFLGC